MTYAKIVTEHTIEYPPTNYVTDTEVSYNVGGNPAWLRAHGYYELTYPDGQQDATPTYTLRNPVATETTQTDEETGETYEVTSYDIPFPVIVVSY